MPWTATFSNPRYNYTGGASGLSDIVPVVSWEITQSFDIVSEAILKVATDVTDKYNLETDDSNNPVQKNGTMVLKLDADTWFTGYVVAKPLVRSGLEGNYLQVRCWGWDGILAQALCPDTDGSYVWSLSTSTKQVSQVPLETSSEYGTYQGDTLWPDPGDAIGAKCYLQDSDCNDDALATAIGVGTYAINYVNQGAKTFGTAANVPDEFIADEKFTVDGSTGNDGEYTIASATWTGSRTEVVVDEAIPDSTADGDMLQDNIVLSTSSQGFKPRGWAKVDSEWLYFDGYDNAAADGKYRLRNCVRGVLGTTAAAHAASTTLYEKLGKQLGPGSIKIEHDPGSGYITLRRDKQYAVMVDLGAFVLAGDSSGTYRGTYYVYDEDQTLGGSTVVTLDDVLEKIVTAPADYGGAGFASSDCSFAVSTIKINRFDYHPSLWPKYALDVIRELIASLSLEDTIKFWFRHDTGKFRAVVLANGTKAFDVPHIEGETVEESIEDVHSGVNVAFTDDQNLNRATATYSWHQAGSGGSGTTPTNYYGVASGGEDWQYPSPSTHNAAGNGGMEYTCDGKLGSKLGATFNHDPGDSIEFAHWWFGSGTTPPAITLDRLAVWINTYREIDSDQPHKNNDNTYVMRMQGCDDYNTSTHTGTWVDLGLEIEGIPDKYGRSVKGEVTAFIKPRVNAVRAVWDYMAGIDTGNPVHYAWVHHIEIEGDTEKYVYVQLTDDASKIGDASYLYAPASYEKMRGGVKSSGAAGCPRSSWFPIGAGSEASAVSMGRIYLTVKLAQFQRRHWEYRGLLPAQPRLNLTLGLDEDGDGTADYIGVVHSVTVNSDPVRGMMARGTVRDHSGDVIE